MGKNPAQKAKAQAAAAVEKKAHSKSDKKKAVKAQVEAKATKSSKPRSEMTCKIKNCKRDYKAKGYCKPHYTKWRHGEFGVARYKTCKANECRKAMTMNRHGYCEEHYQNFYVKGMSSTALVTETPAEEKKSA